MIGLSKVPRTSFTFLSALALLWLPSDPGVAGERIAHHGLWVTVQEAAALPEPPASRVEPGWGTLDSSTYTVGACEATVLNNLQPAEIANCVRVTPVLNPSTSTPLGFPVHLPNGALIDAITANYYDTVASSDPSLGFYRSDGVGNLEPLIEMIPPPSDTGNMTVTFTPGAPPQVDNDGGSYMILVILHADSGTEFEGIYNFTVRYRLQVSPAPAFATFADVPEGHMFHRFVEALAASGITAGCGGGNFCVDSPVTRGQMAVFISKALGLHFPN